MDDDANKLAFERLRGREKRREELRSISDDESSALIDVEARERLSMPKSSHPAPAKFFLGVLNSKPSAGAVIIALGILALAAFAIAKGFKFI